MTEAQRETPSADPACHDPAGVRRESCTCCGATREPDPTDEFIGMLKELGQLGMRLARHVVVEVEEAAVPAAAPEEPAVDAKLLAERRATWQAAVLAHQRLTRSIRLCMALAVKFHEDRLAREKQIEARAAEAKVQRRKRLKEQLDNVVAKTIERELAVEKERLLASEDEEYDELLDEEKSERLYEALTERLDEEDIELDLGEVAQSAIYGRICADLGVVPDWARWRRVFEAMDAGLQKEAGPSFGPPRPEDGPGEGGGPPDPSGDLPSG